MRYLTRLLNIRPEEWPRFAWLYGMAIVLIVALVWGRTVIEAAFLEQLGVHALPYFLIVNALLSVPATAIYFAFADRVANDSLLIGIFLVSIVGMVGGLILLEAGWVVVGYSFLYLIVFVPLRDILSAHWYTYVNAFYDTQAAKRIIPVLVTSFAIASIVAGLSLPALNRTLTTEQIVLVWAGLLGICAFMTWLLPRVLGDKPVKSPAGAQITYLGNLREGYYFVRESPFLRWMAIAMIVLMVLLTILQYLSSHILLDQLHTTAAISNFVGLLTSIVNLILLPIQLFFLSRLINRIGLGNANLIFPLTTLLASLSLVAFPGLPMAALIYTNRIYLRASIGYPIENLLYNAVPQKIKGRARAFIGGLILPAGMFIGSILLLTNLSTMNNLLNGLVIILSIAFFGCALILRRQYALTIVETLAHENYADLEPADPGELNVADPAALQFLAHKLETPGQPIETTLFLARLTADMGGEAAIPILDKAARTGDQRVRAAILDITNGAGWRDDRLYRLYSDYLQDPDPTIRLSAVTGRSRLDGPDSPTFLKLALQMVNDPSLELRSELLPILLRSNIPAYQEVANTALDELLSSDQPALRQRGVQVLGQLNYTAAFRRLIQFLADPADEVRLYAAVTLESHLSALPKHLLPLLIEAITPLLSDPVERNRQAALLVLGKIGPRSLYPTLATSLTDASPQVRSTVVDVLAEIGKAIVPMIHPLLDAPPPTRRKMVAVVLTRINRPEYSPLINTHITGNLIETYQNIARIAVLQAATTPGLLLLGDWLGQENRRLTDEIFYLFTALHDQEALEVMVAALTNPDERMQANGLEALESYTSPQMSGLIGPLLQPGVALEQLLATGRDNWALEIQPLPDLVLELAAHPSNDWLRALATYCLTEVELSRPEQERLLSAALADPAPDVAAAARARQTTLPNGVAMLSTIEKIIFLKEVPFFQSMNLDQLKLLAGVCEEISYPTETNVYHEGDPGGSLYMVITGQVAIEREGKRKGSSARLQTINAHSYFGEMNLFDNSPRDSYALTTQESRLLRLRREPLIALSRQSPDLSLELINVLSKRLREANDRVADLTRTRPREVQKLFDQLG